MYELLRKAGTDRWLLVGDKDAGKARYQAHELEHSLMSGRMYDALAS